jgi:hypothetical protein
MNKKGASHVEVIVSFIIFIGFIGAMFYFFNPSSSSKLADSSADYAFREINNNAKTTLDSVSVKINKNFIPSGQSVISIKITGLDANKNAIAKDYYGNRLNVGRQGDTFYLGWVNSDFAVIELNEEFPDGGTGSVGLNESYYEIASSESRELLSENKIIAIKERYVSDYSKLRDDFNLPNRINWAFSLTFSSGQNITADVGEPQNAEVISNKKSVEVLRTDGKTEFADLQIKVW